MDAETKRTLHLIALQVRAEQIWEQYRLGNKSDARATFEALSPDYRGYVAFCICKKAMIEWEADELSEGTWTSEVEKFFESVTH